MKEENEKSKAKAAEAARKLSGVEKKQSQQAALGAAAKNIAGSSEKRRSQ